MAINSYKPNSSSVSREAKIFLMSTAVASDNIVDALREKISNNKDGRYPKLMVFEDGWNKFSSGSELSVNHRLNHRMNGLVERIWTRKWLKYVLGRNAVISSTKSEMIDNNSLSCALNAYDTVVMPGGNTFQLMRGIYRNRAVIRNKVNEGNVLYIGESSGSIISGLSTYPALIRPGDPCPSSAHPERALNLIEADVIIHAEGHKLDNPVPIYGTIANLALRSCTSRIEDIIDYTNVFRNINKQVLILNDGQAADIMNGKLSIIE